VSWQRKDKPVLEYTRWERIRMVIEELGPTFIKLAQLLSNRPDILPLPLIHEFEKLQNQVPPFDVKTAIKIIEKETKKSLDELFVYFDRKCIGSASIGQVHRARLATGEDVVVKIQRPEAKEKVATDLNLLHEFIKLTENYFIQNGILNPLEIVETFEKTMLQELDYTVESKNMFQFRKIFDKQKKFYIPRTYSKLGTKKVLINEFISGCHITDKETLVSWAIKPDKIVKLGVDVYIKQIFEYGIFHADPHPGNILIKPSGKISLIDFGMVGKITKSQRQNLAGILLGLVNKNPKSMAIFLQRLSFDAEIDNIFALENDLEAIINDYTIEQPGFGQLIGRLQKIFYNYKLHIPGQVFLILRGISLIDLSFLYKSQLATKAIKAQSIINQRGYSVVKFTSCILKFVINNLSNL